MSVLMSGRRVLTLSVITDDFARWADEIPLTVAVTR